MIGQNKIDFKFTRDYESILKATKDSKNKLFYDDLFKRFEKADTTLTDYEMIALQIGYTDNPNYWPYQDVELEREIWDLNANKEFDKAKKLLDTLLTNNPFSILGHKEMNYIYRKLGNKELEDIYFKKFNMIVESVLSTGRGTSYESSWFTLSPADGQWIIKIALKQSICFTGSGYDENGNFHDILGISNADTDECIKLYFNINPASKRILGKNSLSIEELVKNLEAEKKKKDKKKKRKKENKK
jgi:hypothetical protein